MSKWNQRVKEKHRKPCRWGIKQPECVAIGWAHGEISRCLKFFTFRRTEFFNFTSLYGRSLVAAVKGCQEVNEADTLLPVLQMFGVMYVSHRGTQKGDCVLKARREKCETILKKKAQTQTDIHTQAAETMTKLHCEHEYIQTSSLHSRTRHSPGSRMNGSLLPPRC